MEVMSCSSSQGAEQVETHGGLLTMDEMLLDVDVEDPTVDVSVLKPELDDSNAEVVIEETENLGNNVEGESSSPSEPKWLQQDEPVALWVKVLKHHLSLLSSFFLLKF